MAEKWVVVTLISRDFGGSWNPVRRLLETDSRAVHFFKSVSTS